MTNTPRSSSAHSESHKKHRQTEKPEMPTKEQLDEYFKNVKNPEIAMSGINAVTSVVHEDVAQKMEPFDNPSAVEDLLKRRIPEGKLKVQKNPHSEE